MIVQGFSYHVAANKEELRSKFVNFDGKRELSKDLVVDDIGKVDWEGIVDEFVARIGKFPGKELIDALEPDFSS